MKVTRLPADVFDAVVSTTRMRPQAIEVGRAVLVDGESQVDVAARLNLTKQRVNTIVSGISAAYAQRGQQTAGGDGTVHCTLQLPEELANRLDAFQKAYDASSDPAVRGLAVKELSLAIRSARNLLAPGPG